MTIEHPRCICGKKCKRKKNGEMGKTCGNRSCAGIMSKIHMRKVLKTTQSTFHIPSANYNTFWD